MQAAAHHNLITGDRLGLGVALAKTLYNHGNRNTTLISNPYAPVDEQDLANTSIEIVHGELLDLPFLKDQIHPNTTVYHTDIMVSLEPKLSSFLYNHNVLGTQNLVNVALDKQIAHVVYVGSAISQNAVNRDYIEIADTIFQADLEIARGEIEGLSTIKYAPGLIINQDDETDHLHYTGSGQIPTVNMSELLDAIVQKRTYTSNNLRWDDSANHKFRLQNTIDIKAYKKQNLYHSILSKIVGQRKTENARRTFFSTDFS